jgi:hypothetical protein
MTPQPWASVLLQLGRLIPPCHAIEIAALVGDQRAGRLAALRAIEPFEDFVPRPGINNLRQQGRRGSKARDV